MPETSAPAIPRGGGQLPLEAFRLLVDGTAAPFVLIDRRGVIRYVSGTVDTTLGWEPDQLVGRNMAEFLQDDQVGTAIEAIEEIDTIDRAGAGVPMVFAITRPDGSSTWVEVGAVPMLDMPELDVIALRLTPWNAQHAMGDFLAALLADASLATVLVPLARSIAASLDSVGAAVHHGFDGRSFGGAAGSWGGAAELPLDEGPWCEVARSGMARWLDDAAGAEILGARACWSVPVGTDAVAPAVLSVFRPDPGPPLIGHRHAMARLSEYVRLALVRTAEHQRLRHLAGHDSLTGIANRASFRDRLAQALAIGERDLAVAFCDLDRFKPVNDTYGHRVGDQVLVEVATRLRDTLRVGDELARIGGDEFTLLLRNVPDAATAGHVADRLLAAMTAPFAVPGGEVSLGMSVGVALARPSASAEELLNTADAALYACKRAGGGHCAVVD